MVKNLGQAITTSKVVPKKEKKLAVFKKRWDTSSVLYDGRKFITFNHNGTMFKLHKCNCAKYANRVAINTYMKKRETYLHITSAEKYKCTRHLTID